MIMAQPMRAWLRQSAEQLANGHDVVWRIPGASLRGVTRQRLFAKLQESGEFVALAVEWGDMVLAGVPETDKRRRQVRNDLHQLAVAAGIELLAPLADDYAHYRAQQLEH